VRKPFSNGLSVLFNYTYSHSLDTGTGEGGNGMLRTDLWQRAFNPKANYGSSSTDISHNFNGAIVYEVPIGKDRRYLNKGGIANSVIGGWQASTILLVHSGLPFTPVMGTANLSGSLAGPWFPNRLADGSRSSPTVQEWFDPSAFVQPVPFTFGNSGRNILYGPSFAEVNFSLAKSFAIPIRGEQTRLQIRADAMDLFNHPNFGQPNTAIGTTGAGIVSSALTSRVIQLGAVLRF